MAGSLIDPRPRVTKVQALGGWLGRNGAAILISLLSAGFTGWYAWDNHKIRIENQQASAKQADDTRRAREAAEKSARAAESFAETMKQSAKATSDGVEFQKENVAAMRQLVRT